MSKNDFPEPEDIEITETETIDIHATPQDLHATPQGVHATPQGEHATPQAARDDE